MADPAPAPGPDDPAPRFRRATPQDAVELCRSTFLADRRVDMQTLASQLGISRATLHRWVQTREKLLDRVLGELTQEFFDAARAGAAGDSGEVVAETARRLVEDTVRQEPLRGFVQREPELALRLLNGEGGSVRARLLDNIRRLVVEVLPEEAPRLEGFVVTLVQVGDALVWPALVAGDEPSGDEVAKVARALLVAARAGALPPDPA